MSYEYMTGFGATTPPTRRPSGSGIRQQSNGQQPAAQRPATQRPTGGQQAGAGRQPSTSQAQIPAGKVPLGQADKEWYRNWLRRVNSRAYQRQQARDPRWTWADPDMLARFTDAKNQTNRLLRTAVSYKSKGDGGRGWVNTILTFWKKCDPQGAAAWITAPGNQTTLKLPKNIDSAFGYVETRRLVREDRVSALLRDPSGKGSSFTTSTRRKDAIKALSCPSEDAKRLIFGVPSDPQRTKGTDLLARYVREKNRQVAAAARTSQQRLAAQRQQAREAHAQAQQAATEAQALQQQVTVTQQQLAQATLLFDQEREKAAKGQAVSNESLMAMQDEVNRLTAELALTVETAMETRRDADLAEEALDLEQEVMEQSGLPIEPLPPIEELPELPPMDPMIESVMEPAFDPAYTDPAYMDPGFVDEGYTEPPVEPTEASFFEQYKWYLLGGGVAAVGAWYYFMKYKPAQEAAKIAENIEDYLM